MHSLTCAGVIEVPSTVVRTASKSWEKMDVFASTGVEDIV